MKAVYILRVLVLSGEFVVLLFAWLIWTYWPDQLVRAAMSMNLNPEVVKYLMFVPAGVAIWVLNECRLILQEDKETIRILTAWGDYWQLKVHTWVALFYAILFTALSMIPWMFSSAGLSDGAGLLIFATSMLGQLLLATSVYAARIRLKEIIANTRAP